MFTGEFDVIPLGPSPVYTKKRGKARTSILYAMKHTANVLVT